MSRKVSIEFMEQEYQALVEMIQIADWVINADDDNEVALEHVAFIWFCILRP